MEYRKWSINRSIALLAFWQGFSVLMIAVFNWPGEIIWLSFVLSAAFIFFADAYYSIIYLIISIPFYVVLPNPYFETLSAWRPLFALLFAAWLLKNKSLDIKSWGLMPWDKILGYFALVCLIITLLFSRFAMEGLKQLLFFANIYLFYAVFINTVKTRQQILGILKAVAASLAVIIAFGYFQLLLTFVADLNFFWVYWADNITRTFYGNFFAQTALYSNSWFSYTNGWELRMFSIQPDSQSFAYICVFGIAFILPLTLTAPKRLRLWLWSVLRFAGFAIMLSGTRAVWAGLLAPFFGAVWLYLKKNNVFFAKKTLWIFAIIFFFFAISPLINLGLRYARFARFEENFVARALSIYNLNESSNAGRILIWKESLKYFARRPWGVGLDNYLRNLNPSENYQKAAEEINKRYNLPQKYITAHSLYLQILVELGIAGFAVFAWFWASLGKTFINFFKKNRAGEDPLAFFVFSAGMAFLWLLAAAFFDVTFFNDKALIYFFISLGLSGIIMKNYERLKET